jgi:sulfatase modifying factor 1
LRRDPPDPTTLYIPAFLCYLEYADESEKIAVNSREHSRTFEQHSAIWLALFLISFTFAIYLARQMIGAAPSPPAPQAAEIERLRRLALADPLQLADTLNRSMVPIAAGDFVMGSNAGRDDERPQHAVYLDAFEMDRYEVANAQYRRFLQATGRRPPPYWDGDTYPDGQADYPVVGVSWDDAIAYCGWAGKRLPTEAEWEKACRSVDGRTYPWGNMWEPRRANVEALDHAASPIEQAGGGPFVWEAAWRLLRITGSRAGPGLRPVGSYLDGASPYGVMDMAGNASEWVSDWYNWRDYTAMPTRNPLNAGPPWNHCLRGSPWHDPTGNAAWTQSMSRCPARNSSHETQDPRVGFRCARWLP